MAAAPKGTDLVAIKAFLLARPGVSAIHDLHVWSIVPGRNAVSAHLLLDRIESWPGILLEARRVLARDFGIDHVTLQPEWLRAHAPEETIALRELR